MQPSCVRDSLPQGFPPSSRICPPMPRKFLWLTVPHEPNRLWGSPPSFLLPTSASLAFDQCRTERLCPSQVLDLGQVSGWQSASPHARPGNGVSSCFLPLGLALSVTPDSVTAVQTHLSPPSQSSLVDFRGAKSCRLSWKIPGGLSPFSSLSHQLTTWVTTSPSAGGSPPFAC